MAQKLIEPLRLDPEGLVSLGPVLPAMATGPSPAALKLIEPEGAVALAHVPRAASGARGGPSIRVLEGEPLTALSGVSLPGASHITDRGRAGVVIIEEPGAKGPLAVGYTAQGVLPLLPIEGES